MKKGLWFLFLTIFIDMLGVGILIPIIPQLLGEPTSPYYLLSPNNVDLGFLLLGFLTASFPLGMFFAAPVLGAISDKYGRRPVLLISILGTSLSYFLFAFGIFTRSITLLFVSRIIDGLTGGNISVAQAAIADQTKPEDRAKTFGMIGAAFGLGFILGPFIGGKLADPSLVSWFTASTPFVFSGILSMINVISIYFFFRETIAEKSNREIDFLGSIRNISNAKKFENVRVLFLISFIFNAGFSFFTSFFNVFLTNKFHMNAGGIGNFFAYIGIWVVFTQAVIVRYITKKKSDVEILRFAYIWTGIAVVAYLFPAYAWQLMLIAPFFAIFNGLQQANFNALLTKKTDPKVRGEVLGISSSVNSLAQSIPPLVAGVIAAIFASWVPVFISGLCIIGAGLLFRANFKK